MTEANKIILARNQVRAHQLLDVLDQVYRSAKLLAEHSVIKWEQVPICCKVFLAKNPLIREAISDEQYASTCHKYGVEVEVKA